MGTLVSVFARAKLLQFRSRERRVNSDNSINIARLTARGKLQTFEYYICLLPTNNDSYGWPSRQSFLRRRCCCMPKAGYGFVPAENCSCGPAAFAALTILNTFSILIVSLICCMAFCFSG